MKINCLLKQPGHQVKISPDLTGLKAWEITDLKYLRYELQMARVIVISISPRWPKSLGRH